MKYYRRKRYADKRTQKIALRILFVIAAAVIISVLASILGNHVKKMVEDAENRINAVETGASENDAPFLGNLNTELPGEKTAASAIGISLMPAEELVPVLASLGDLFDTVSVKITEGGSLVYTSPAMLTLARVPADDPLWSAADLSKGEMEAFASTVKGAGLRLSAVLEASVYEGKVLAENDSALVKELAEMGFDEVIITGLGEITDKLPSYLSAVSHETVSVGVIFPMEDYLNQKNKGILRTVSQSGVLLCAELTVEEGDTAEKEAKALLSTFRSTIETHNLRMVVTSSDDSMVSGAYRALVGSKITNIQIISPISPEALREAAADLLGGDGDETGSGAAETAVPENPYIVTSPDETDAGEEETTQDRYEWA